MEGGKAGRNSFFLLICTGKTMRGNISISKAQCIGNQNVTLAGRAASEEEIREQLEKV